MEKLVALKAGPGATQVDAMSKPVANQQEYDKLPSGAEYTAPDGSRRRKK
jgi:hypothetical protein